MRIRKINGYVKLWLSANDTREWANRPGSKWPCSVIAGNSLFAEFAPNGDLVDVSGDYPVSEFNAITDDFLAGVK